MGQIVLITANGVDLHGTLPNGTRITLEAIDVGENMMEYSWIENFGRGIPTLAAFQDRKTQMAMTFWLEASTTEQMRKDAALVRDEFAVPNTLTWSPDYPDIDVEGIDTYPSPVPPLLSASNPDNLRYMTKLHKVFDWTLVVWRSPYISGSKRSPVV
jgi:hypothetical protein